MEKRWVWVIHIQRVELVRETGRLVMVCPLSFIKREGANDEIFR